MILVMLNQWCVFKKFIQKPRVNLYIGRELAVWSINQRLYLELRHVICWEYYIDIMCSIYIIIIIIIINYSRESFY